MGESELSSKSRGEDHLVLGDMIRLHVSCAKTELSSSRIACEVSCYL